MSRKELNMKDRRQKTYCCCFCGKEISFTEKCNPDPLAQEADSWCCCDCSEHYVMPVREAFWPIDDKWYSKQYPYIAQLTLNEIERTRSQTDPNAALQRIVDRKIVMDELIIMDESKQTPPIPLKSRNHPLRVLLSAVNPSPFNAIFKKRLDLSKEDPSLLQIASISVLQMSPKLHNSLAKNGITSLEDIIQKTPADILAIENVDEENLDEVCQKLAEVGLALRGD